MVTPNQLWRRAGCERARYLALLREYGFIYEREDGATAHTATKPRAPTEAGALAPTPPSEGSRPSPKRIDNRQPNRRAQRMAATTKERLDKWRESGPMRKWRAKNSFGLHDASAVLGVSVSSLQTLESGKMPSEEMLKRIYKGMGHSEVASLRTAWRRWLKTKP